MEIVNRQIKAGRYVISVQRSPRHLCGEQTFEIAIKSKNKILHDPKRFPEIQDLLDDRAIAAFATEEDLQRIINYVSKLY